MNSMTPPINPANDGILDTIASFVIKNFLFGDASKKPADTDSLIETGIIDSTGILELIEFLESEFGIAIEESETIPKNLDGLAALSTFVAKKLRTAPGSRPSSPESKNTLS